MMNDIHHMAKSICVITISQNYIYCSFEMSSKSGWKKAIKTCFMDSAIERGPLGGTNDKATTRCKVPLPEAHQLVRTVRKVTVVEGQRFFSSGYSRDYVTTKSMGLYSCRLSKKLKMDTKVSKWALEDSSLVQRGLFTFTKCAFTRGVESLWQLTVCSFLALLLCFVTLCAAWILCCMKVVSNWSFIPQTICSQSSSSIWPCGWSGCSFGFLLAELDCSIFGWSFLIDTYYSSTNTCQLWSIEVEYFYKTWCSKNVSWRCHAHSKWVKMIMV